MQRIDQVILVLTTVPADLNVDALARDIVDRDLAACVSVLPPMVSTYRWQGRIERSDERQVLVKTTRGRLAALEQHVRAAHPYDTPEWLVVDVDGGSAAYLQWVRETRAPD